MLPVSNRKPSISSDNKQQSIPIQSVAPATIPQPPKSVAVPAPSPDKPKPNVISPLSSTFTDPLEQSLASLEHDIIKSEPIENNIPIIGLRERVDLMHPLHNPNTNPNLNVPLLQSSMGMEDKAPHLAPGMLLPNSLFHEMHETMEHEMPPVMQQNATNMMHATNNGFNMKHEYDMTTNNNGLSSMGIPMSMSISSMFDPLPQQQQPPKKEPMLYPKPIEELTDPVPNLLMDKKMTPPEQKHSQSFTFKTKQEQNVKNASSWSSLAQASSPQNSSASGSSSKRPQQVMDSFKAFQNKAKEKADREKQRLENLELKRQQKEQAEKERLRVENERRREREEEDALEKAR